MANGKLHDHPYTDIMHHHREVYSPCAAALVREIAALGDVRTREALAEMLMREFNALLSPDIPRLEQVLTKWRDRLVNEARERGYELGDK